MRVLFNAMQAGNQSGTGRYVEELLRALVALNDAPELTVAWPKDRPTGEWADAVKLLRYSRGLRHRLRLDRDLFSISLDVDVVHYPATIGPLWPAKNLVLTVHDCIPIRHPEWFRWERAFYYIWAGRRSVRNAEHIIADSTATAHDLHELMEIPPGRVTTVPLGVNDTFCPQPQVAIDAVRTRYQLPERFFLYVGTLEPRKNLACVVRAWDRIASDIPEDLVIAGRIGWKTEELDIAIATAQHRDRIHRPGFIDTDDLPALICAARAFVWPSLYEGFGLPVLEAMAARVPVLTSNVSSLPEVIGDTGILVDPENEADLEAGLNRLIFETGDEADRVEAAWQRAQGMTWSHSARILKHSYQAVLDGAGYAP
ncbi:MAG: glycosyltransferase family 4 protein [Candidatus Hydrogenedentes bacterium]|nr:glycosyltransferase family 4 protein [Candidatus Hydrogenedentota bacterium]